MFCSSWWSTYSCYWDAWPNVETVVDFLNHLLW